MLHACTLCLVRKVSHGNRFGIARTCMRPRCAAPSLRQTRSLRPSESATLCTQSRASAVSSARHTAHADRQTRWDLRMGTQSTQRVRRGAGGRRCLHTHDPRWPRPPARAADSVRSRLVSMRLALLLRQGKARQGKAKLRTIPNADASRRTDELGREPMLNSVGSDERNVARVEHHRLQRNGDRPCDRRNVFVLEVKHRRGSQHEQTRPYTEDPSLKLRLSTSEH